MMPGLLITANRLDDGVVVWMTADFTWTETRSLAGMFDADTVQSARRSAAGDQANNSVTAVYEVMLDGRADVSARERIRANQGPTIQPPRDRHPPMDRERIEREESGNVSI